MSVKNKYKHIEIENVSGIIPVKTKDSKRIELLEKALEKVQTELRFVISWLSGSESGWENEKILIIRPSTALAILKELNYIPPER